MNMMHVDISALKDRKRDLAHQAINKERKEHINMTGQTPDKGISVSLFQLSLNSVTRAIHEQSSSTENTLPASQLLQVIQPHMIYRGRLMDLG